MVWAIITGVLRVSVRTTLPPTVRDAPGVDVPIPNPGVKKELKLNCPVFIRVLVRLPVVRVSVRVRFPVTVTGPAKVVRFRAERFIVRARILVVARELLA